MAGTLHIFRRNDSPLEYQANYNLGAASWVRVFDPEALDHFLRLGTGLAPGNVDAMLKELRDNGHTSGSSGRRSPNRTWRRWDSPESPSDE